MRFARFALPFVGKYVIWVNTQKKPTFERIGCIPKSTHLAMKDLKYLFAYTVPVSAYLSFASTGIWTYTAVFYAFLIIPIMDVIAGETKDNLTDDDVSYKKSKWIFDAYSSCTIDYNVAVKRFSMSNYAAS